MHISLEWVWSLPNDDSSACVIHAFCNSYVEAIETLSIYEQDS